MQKGAGLARRSEARDGEPVHPAEVPISQRILTSLVRSSWIRRMFDEGRRMRRQWGDDRVFDFSLGSPNLEPPAEFKQALRKLVNDDAPGAHRYMATAGLQHARAAFAAKLSREAGFVMPPSHVILTVGAAGALNVLLQSLLNPGDEVILLAPYFAEYLFYVEHARGKSVVVPTDPATFLPDPGRIAAAISPRTRALIINTPNNPSGRNYPRALLEELAAVVEGQPIYLVADEPYKHILFKGSYTSPLELAANAVVAGSHSKDLGIAGERIGYLAVSPRAPGSAALLRGATFCQRTLGFVNAPALMQRAAALCQDVHIDLAPYRASLEALMRCFRACGLEFIEPEGGLFLFPRVPAGEDDLGFVRRLKDHGLLTVPGRAFGAPEYFRVSIAVDPDMLLRSLPVWRKALGAG